MCALTYASPVSVAESLAYYFKFNSESQLKQKKIL